MTIEETLRAGEVHTGENGMVYGTILPANGHPPPAVFDRPLEKMVACVPRAVVSRMGRSACYFVPRLIKQRRSVLVATGAEENDTRKELCHHLDIKPQSNVLLISTGFYERDSYGLAMEFFDKIGYLASLERDSRTEFYDLLREQARDPKGGELTVEAWEWRRDLPAAAAEAESSRGAGEAAWLNYERAAEADSLGVYMAALFTDVFYEDLFEPNREFPPLSPEGVYRRMRVLERLYPPNRGYSLQVVRQRSRRRGGRAG